MDIKKLIRSKQDNDRGDNDKENNEDGEENLSYP